MAATARKIARFARAPVQACACLGIAALLLAGLAGDAQAYLDPGSTNFFIQAIVGAVLGAAIYLKLQWKRIVGATRRLLGSDGNDEQG